MVPEEKNGGRLPLKEIRMRIKPPESEVAFKLGRGRKLLSDGFRLRITVILRGSETNLMNDARQLIAKAVSMLEGVAVPEGEVFTEGRRVKCDLAPRIPPCP